VKHRWKKAPASNKQTAAASSKFLRSSSRSEAGSRQQAAIVDTYLYLPAQTPSPQHKYKYPAVVV
jgi:hypothetical protein